jgi:hypothetical protein
MNKLALLFALLLAVLLGGCATSGKPAQQTRVKIPVIGPIAYSANDSAVDVARDIAKQFPLLSKFHSYPQTVVTSIGDIHRTGVAAIQEGDTVHLYYQNYRMITPGSDPNEVLTSTLCDLTVVPIPGMPGKFTITPSPVSEEIGHSLLFIPYKPLAPIDQIASDIENTLSKLHQTDDARDLARLKQDAAAGDVNAQNSLAILYQEGRYVPRDELAAIKWSHMAAEQGYAPAEFTLGLLYGRRGLMQNYAEAVKWYRKAAEQGQAAAMNNLGNLYSSGEGGLTQDYAEAYKWWILAKANSSPGSETYNSASRNVDSATNRIVPSQIARAQQEASDWMATHQGAH